MSTIASKFASPLAGYEDAPPLTDEKNEDGKSYKNPQSGVLSKSYERFERLDNGRRGGFDVHIYYLQTNVAQTKYAQELWERIRREFPELRIYRVWDRPIGPHPVAMFEVNVFTPVQFGAFIPWLVVHRGPLSALVHPNTVAEEGEESASALQDHVSRAFWLGDKYPLDVSMFKGA